MFLKSHDLKKNNNKVSVSKQKIGLEFEGEDLYSRCENWDLNLSVTMPIFMKKK